MPGKELKIDCRALQPKAPPAAAAPAAESSKSAAPPATPAAQASAATPAAPAQAAASSGPAVPATPTPPQREPGRLDDPNTLSMGAARQEVIANMEAMGFERSQIDAAMRAAFFNPDRAVEYLLNVRGGQSLFRLPMPLLSRFSLRGLEKPD